MCGAPAITSGQPADKGSQTSVPLTHEEAIVRLDELESTIRRYSARVAMGEGKGWEAAIASARGKIGKQIDSAEVAKLIEGVMQATGEERSVFRTNPAWWNRVPNAEGVKAKQAWLPFALEPVVCKGEVRFAAVSDARMNLIGSGETPYVVSLNGIPVREWVNAAMPRGDVPEPFRVREACRMLSLFSEWRDRVGGGDSRARVDANQIVVKFADANPVKQVERSRSFRLWSKPVSCGPWPNRTSRIIDGAGGKVGYLRPAMAERPGFDEAWAWLPAYRETQGLVIDLRGDGQSADAMLDALAAFLLPRGEGVVIGAARVLLVDGTPEARCAAALRSLRLREPGADQYRDQAKVAAQRNVKMTAAANFAGSDRFGPTLFRVLDQETPPPEGSGIVPYFYKRPVVVLVDGGTCAGAERIAAGLQAIQRATGRDGKPLRPVDGAITIIGQHTGGWEDGMGSGTGRVRRRIGSWVEVEVRSMVMFDDGGRVVHNTGLAPDQTAEEAATDRVVGGGDGVLSQAMEVIRKSNGK